MTHIFTIFFKTEHWSAFSITPDILAHDAVRSLVNKDLLSFLVPKEGVTV